MSTNSKLHSIRFLPLLILAMLVNILAQAAHETGHHMVYQVMEHEPVWAFTGKAGKAPLVYRGDERPNPLSVQRSTRLFLMKNPRSSAQKPRMFTLGFFKVVQLSETTPTNPEEWTEKTNADGTTSWLKSSSLPSGKIENVLAAAAGPLGGLFGAVLGLVMLRRSGKVTSKQAWLAFALTTSLVAVLYYLRSYADRR